MVKGSLDTEQYLDRIDASVLRIGDRHIFGSTSWDPSDDDRDEVVALREEVRMIDPEILRQLMVAALESARRSAD